MPFQYVINGLALGSIYALIALGFSLIYKSTDILNLAHGEIMMISAFFAFVSHKISFFFLDVLCSSLTSCRISGAYSGSVDLSAADRLPIVPGGDGDLISRDHSKGSGRNDMGLCRQDSSHPFQ